MSSRLSLHAPSGSMARPLSSYNSIISFPYMVSDPGGKVLGRMHRIKRLKILRLSSREIYTFLYAKIIFFLTGVPQCGRYIDRL